MITIAIEHANSTFNGQCRIILPHDTHRLITIRADALHRYNTLKICRLWTYVFILACFYTPRITAILL